MISCLDSKLPASRLMKIRRLLLLNLAESRSFGMKLFRPMFGKNSRRRKDRKNWQNFILVRDKEKQFWEEKIRKMKTRGKEILMMKIKAKETTTSQSRRKRTTESTASQMRRFEDSSKATKSFRCL